MNLTINKVSHHRNGVCGVPFTVILFTDNEIGGGPMVATISDDDTLACHVLNIGELNRGNIEFANGNSWRGDRYAGPLLELVESFEKRN
jgi:hypothetical protein